MKDPNWLTKQLDAWPNRIDEASTTNVTFLMQAAAARIRILEEALIATYDNNRIKDLIRYNSEQVVKRRVLNAHLDVCLKALINASGWFRTYARDHRAKGTKEADTKALTNDIRADLLDSAVTWKIDPSEMGRP